MSQDLYRCTASDLATQSIASQSPETTVSEAVDWLETCGFDVAPVVDDEDTVLGYVTVEQLQAAESSAKIVEYTVSITLEEIISTDAAFDEVLSALYDSAFYFSVGRTA